jgi:hypothetical protein
MVCRLRLCGLKWSGLLQAQWVKAPAFIAPESQSQLMQVSILGARSAMEPAKPRKWTEEETKLLVELVRRKERVPAMARELGRHIASVRRRARELGLLLPQGRDERQL